MKLLPQLYIILQRGETVEECPACNRILLFQGFLAQETSEEEVSVEANA
jgi:predicted  nucleic acid-binding Zn-ribbon protein